MWNNVENDYEKQPASIGIVAGTIPTGADFF